MPPFSPVKEFAMIPCKWALELIGKPSTGPGQAAQKI